MLIAKSKTRVTLALNYDHLTDNMGDSITIPREAVRKMTRIHTLKV